MNKTMLAICALSFAAGLPAAHAAEPLPAETKAILQALKLGEDVVAGMDEEARVPPDWLAKAKAEGAVNIIGSWDPPQFQKLAAPFRARYPDVKVSYVRGGLHDRGVKQVLAYKQGRYISDVIISLGGEWVNFRDIGALEDLRQLPNYRRLAPDMREASGHWVGQKIAYRCMVYNTTKVKKSELPKTWDDLVNSPRWQDGKLGVPNRPNLWLSMLWLKNGPDWTRNFMTKLFNDVKPQLRKEGANAMIGLTIAGEFDAAVAAAEYRISQYQSRGAPVAFHCPSPVPMAISLLVVLKNNPHRYGSLVFANWFLSKEGQLAQFHADEAISVRKEFSGRKEFMPYPEEIAGKPIAIRDEAKLVNEYPKLIAYYDPLWKKAGGDKGGAKLLSLDVKLTGVKGKGRTIVFDQQGKATEVTISARRTAVSIGGAKASRADLKAGMSCKVTYPGPGQSASAVACAK
jgi:iron(III) transport system substrate-binding protein